MQVRLFGSLRQHTGQLTVDGHGATVGEALRNLCATYPSLEQAILEDDRLQAHVRVMINGHDIELAAGLNTVVVDGDQLAIFPPMAGGDSTQDWTATLSFKRPFCAAWIVAESPPTTGTHETTRLKGN